MAPIAHRFVARLVRACFAGLSLWPLALTVGACSAPRPEAPALESQPADPGTWRVQEAHSAAVPLRLAQRDTPAARPEPARLAPDAEERSLDEPAEPATLPPEGIDPDGREALLPYLTGTASWYGPGFHGRLTANGEVYNQYGLTAAHPVLPMGTKIEVENLENGRKIWLRVNDRGPYMKARILDLTRIGAEHLGIVDRGTAPVRIRVLKWPTTLDTELGIAAYRQFVVQVAAYPAPEGAEAQRRLLQERFRWAAFFVDRPPAAQYAVVIGPFDDEAEAGQAAARLHARGVTPFVRSYRK
jgi:rare lipoprotein A